MTSSLHNCTLAAEAWASCVCVHACVRMRAWEYLSTKCICSPTLRRQHMFIMGVDQQGSWDSSPWALAEIRSPCTWLSAGHQSTAVKVAENRVHSWSRGFLTVLRVSTICTEEEEEEEERVHRGPKNQMTHTGVTEGFSPKSTGLKQ